MRITIEPDTRPGMYRCVVPLGKEWALPMPIQGQGTEKGAWAEGFGSSPEEALIAAYQTIGRAVVRAASEERSQ